MAQEEQIPAGRILVQGNEALGWASLMADCEAFFGYPITPVNEVAEWCSREFPKRGKMFLQTSSEVASINMVAGAAMIGARVFTATSAPGWGLMQEALPLMIAAQLPAVIVLVQRAYGSAIRHGQNDYFSACYGGGAGGGKKIVITPASVQETHDLMQLAFHLADKYRNPTILLTDAVIGQMMEPLEVRKLDFGPLPSKDDWALVGTGNRKDGRRRSHPPAGAMPTENFTPPLIEYLDYMEMYDKKWKAIEQSEVQHEGYRLDNAKLVLVAFGYAARVSKEVVNWARSDGIKIGLIRPITAWPFPYHAIREAAEKGCRHFVVVEDNLGQMIVDVRLALEGRATIHHIGVLERHRRDPTGLIQPQRVFAEAKKILGV